jgi:hypothetical protein
MTNDEANKTLCEKVDILQEELERAIKMNALYAKFWQVKLECRRFRNEKNSIPALDMTGNIIQASVIVGMRMGSYESTPEEHEEVTRLAERSFEEFWLEYGTPVAIEIKYLGKGITKE